MWTSQGLNLGPPDYESVALFATFGLFFCKKKLIFIRACKIYCIFAALKLTNKQALCHKKQMNPT